MLRFYTLPPYRVQYPFVLVNLNKTDKGMYYIKRNKSNIREILVDSGVEIFRDLTVTEYPEGAKGRVDKAASFYYRLRDDFHITRVIVTVPDYPDDYHPYNLWINEDRTNIERTVENVVYAVDQYPDVPWLIPVQGHNKDPYSIERAISKLKEVGILKKYRRFAVANLCVEQDISIIIRTLQVARFLLPTKEVHSFGLHLRSITAAYSWGLLDSTDSMAWTRPCGLAQILYNIPRGEKVRSAWNEKEREIYFLSWLLTLASRVELEGLSRKKIGEMLIERIERLDGR